MRPRTNESRRLALLLVPAAVAVLWGAAPVPADDAPTVVLTVRHKQDKFTGYVHSVCFSPDGKRILTGSYDHTAKVWEVPSAKPEGVAESGKELVTLEGTGEAVVGSAVFSPDGKRILVGYWSRAFAVWEVPSAKPEGVAENGKLLLTVRGHLIGINSVAFSPDGKRILTGSHDGTAKVWDAESGKELLTLKGHTREVRNAKFSPDGKRILTASYDKTARIWDAESGKELLALKGHADWVYDAAFSPDGKSVLTGSKDNTAKVWDAKTGAELLTLNGHTSWVSSVAFSPDGKRIATGSYDRTAKLWNAESGQEIATLASHTHWVNSVCFSPDGKKLATASQDKSAKVWDLGPKAK